MPRLRPVLVIACAAFTSGCAIRYDNTGVSRVGVGLWGFGDPPGVNWNLDWPVRRESLELPPHRDSPELPPRREPVELPPRSPQQFPDLPRSFLEFPDVTSRASQRDAGAPRDDVIDDDRCPAVAGESSAHCVPRATRADLRGSFAPRS